MIILPETEGMLVERWKVRQIVCLDSGRRSIQEREPEFGPL